MFSKKEFDIVSNLRFISRTKFMLGLGPEDKTSENTNEMVSKTEM